MSSTVKVFIILGILSVSQLFFGELALGQGRRGGGGGWGGGGGRVRGNGPMSDDEIAQRLADTETSLKNMDANGNGVIDTDEANDPMAAGQLERIFRRMGKDPHYPVSVADIMKDYEANLRGRNSNGGATPAADSSGAASIATSAAAPKSSSAAAPAAVSHSVSQASAAPATDAKQAAKKPARFLTARERLPKGLPDWFLEKDVHGEGQVTMAEYTTNWTPEKVAEFARYDLNHDGIITAEECLKVEKAKAGSK